MDLNLSSNLIQNLTIFIPLGLVCYIYNKPIANEMSKLYTYPIKWIFGEKAWFEQVKNIIIWGLRIGLYSGTLISIIALLLTLGSILRINS